MESSIKTWFTALSVQDKQLFLATSGANLTAFARQATRLGELRGMNEIHHHIYQAFKAISAGQLTFNANELWEALNFRCEGVPTRYGTSSGFRNVQNVVDDGWIHAPALYVISSSCSVRNYKIPTRAADFVDSPHASSRSVMFLITSPKNECTLASQLMEGVYSIARIDAVYRYLY